MKRIALLLSLLLGTSLGAQEAPRRVAVLPIQALTGDVPSRAGPRVTLRLATELRAVEGWELAEPPPSEPPEVLAQARAFMKDAEARRQQRDFAGAEAALGKAIEAFSTVAAELPSGNELADAHALRAAVRYAQGQDEEAARSLSSALSLSPGRTLPLTATSPLFARTVERVHAALREQPRGSVRFTSVPPGVTLTIDGQPVGIAPVRVVEVPPGAHLWRAVLPSGEATGGIVEAVSGKEVEVRVKPPGEGPGAVLASALASNRLDTASVEAAEALAQTLRADLAVLGTISRSGSGLALDAFLFVPGSRTLRRVPRIALDIDLLDAGPPLRELTAVLTSRGAEAGSPVTLPTAPSSVAVEASRLAQVKYPLQDKPVSAPKPTAPTPDRAPLNPRKPLVRP
ncbi:PEGA domain-containing protein [Hyalangium rubrum]|uniref:PEGA domain-containing protein n=1 Tax=Hyalangium rubrum TaxID=3103134 RepID=A0ABU5H008_9BACT|nr:PEGA domain-containing protein [Hyalangium sp. s54d21]MDY7226621.1 PEGA domain-containing protein [Hyalangium sp. s54d21]